MSDGRKSEDSPADTRGDTAMALAHRIEVVLSEGGKLSLDHLPFRAGRAVEVIVLAAAVPHPLRG